MGVRSLIYMTTLTGLMTLTGGALLTVLEPETVGSDLGNGVWWAIVTVSTVGYGDIAPTTALGRSVAVLLMMLGLGLLSTLAAAISAFFIESDSDADMAGLRQQLDRIERRLERMESGEGKNNYPN